MKPKVGGARLRNGLTIRAKRHGLGRYAAEPRPLICHLQDGSGYQPTVAVASSWAAARQRIGPAYIVLETRAKPWNQDPFRSLAPPTLGRFA